MTEQANGSGTRDEVALALPRRTTPTWEVELLISGVAVFAMLQLPGMFDDALFALRPRFDAAWHDPLRMMHVYLKSASVILAATFAIHLLMRAHWIALVGMHSIYPDGVRWDKLRIGPVQREQERARGGDPALVIDRADNRATTVFAMGVVLATLLLSVSLLAVLVFGLCLAVLALAGADANVSSVFLASVLMSVVPFALASAIDRRFGANLAPRGLPHRVLSAMFRFYGFFGFGRGSNAMALLSSHQGERRTVLLVFAIFLPVMLGVMFGARAMQSPERLGGYGMFPMPAPAGGRLLDDAHYDLRRNPARDPAVPFIPDLVVTGPYLRLLVPFTPGSDDRAMRSQCKQAAAVEPLSALQCLQVVHAVSLDGKPVARLRYDAGTDPRTGRPALVAMIDVRPLAPGRHQLRVARAEPDGDGDRDWHIPFWR